jgi:competence protein ComFC
VVFGKIFYDLPDGKSMLRKILCRMFPQKCISCGDFLKTDGDYGQFLLCGNCLKGLIPISRLSGVKCRNCGIYLYSAETDLCYRCRNFPMHFTGNTSLYYYQEPAIRELMHRFKFESNKTAGRLLAGFLKNEIQFFLENHSFDAVLITPLSADAFRKRGYNQVGFVLKECGISFLDILIRNRHRKHQSELTAEERKRTIAGQFGIKDGNLPLINKKKLLLMDDILTTGSTADEISRILLDKGAKSVEVLTFFRD